MYIGIDLGGTKIEAVVLNDDGDELVRQRVATPATDYQQLIKAVVALVRAVEEQVNQRCQLGIGTPGSPSAVDGRMKNCNTECLNGQRLQHDLEHALGRNIRLANDANCLALSEAVDGAGYGLPVVFGVILGTGVGGGIVVNNQLLVGPSGIGSEWGHNCLPGIGVEFEQEPRLCYCGRQNCIETYLSGPGLARSYARLSGRQASAENIAAQALVGESDACRALDLYQRQLAYSLSQVINIIDPDVVVLGGGLSNIPSLYQAVPHLWQQDIFSDQVKVKLLAARHGDSSGVRGAANLWRMGG